MNNDKLNPNNQKKVNNYINYFSLVITEVQNIVISNKLKRIKNVAAEYSLKGGSFLLEDLDLSINLKQICLENNINDQKEGLYFKDNEKSYFLCFSTNQLENIFKSIRENNYLLTGFF